jgi:transposase
MSTTTYVVGIDVAKAQLDMALRPTGERWAVANDEAGMAALVARLQALLPTLIVLEATGGYQRAVVAALAAAGLPVAVVNPRQARAFAKATGQLAKTDALDARAWAHVAEAVRPTPRPLADAQADELRALLARRRQRVTMRTAEQNRLGSAPPAADGHPGPYHLAQCVPRQAGRRPRHDAAGESRVAGARGTVA